MAAKRRPRMTPPQPVSTSGARAAEASGWASPGRVDTCVKPLRGEPRNAPRRRPDAACRWPSGGVGGWRRLRSARVGREEGLGEGVVPAHAGPVHRPVFAERVVALAELGRGVLAAAVNRPGCPGGSFSWKGRSQGETEAVCTGGARAGGSAGPGASGRARGAGGGDLLDRGNDGLLARDAAEVAAAGGGRSRR